MSEGEQEELGFIDVKLDENLYISAELNMPETNLYEYKTELKKFNYEKVQEVLWPDAAKSEISTDECGSRYYKESSFGGEQGSLIYRRNDTTNYDVFKEIIEKPYEEEKPIKFVYVMKNGIMMRVPEEVAKTMDCDNPKSVREINVSNKVQYYKL